MRHLLSLSQHFSPLFFICEIHKHSQRYYLKTQPCLLKLHFYASKLQLYGEFREFEKDHVLIYILIQALCGPTSLL